MSAEPYRKISDLPETLAIFPLSGAILFPRWSLPLNIFEPRYLNMIDDVLSGTRMTSVSKGAFETASQSTSIVLIWV